MSHSKFFIPERVNKVRIQTPFFCFSKQALMRKIEQYKYYLPSETEICYAMKANSEEIVLRVLNDADISFEASSKYELSILKKINVSPKKIIYGSPVKPKNHIKDFVSYGIDRFVFDCESELLKLAKYAPKSRVYVRALVNDHSNSVFQMSEKFGASIDNAIRLLIMAKNLGLIPYGISFNVGSQARNAKAWANGIKDVIKMMIELDKQKIKISVINIGGGFPHTYQKNDYFPNLKMISKYIAAASKKLPYKVSFIAEPGRGLVVDSFALVTSVLSKSMRSNGHWLFLDAGTYNALPEAMICQGKTRYALKLLTDYKKAKKRPFILTGPTCDNIDVFDRKAILAADIKAGDRILIYDAGAYTFALISKFNGFPKPKIIQI